MKKSHIILLLLLLCNKLITAQFNRKPFSLNTELNIPKSISNKAFLKTFSGNLDWNINMSYHTKNKLEIALCYRRTNFKAGYSDRALNTAIKTKFIINAFGTSILYTYFNDSYFYAQAGLATYYCKGIYTHVTYNAAEVANPKVNFIAFEPKFNIIYKSSDYVDVGFQVSTTLLGYSFNPNIAHLDEQNKIDYSNAMPTNAKTAYISFGFQLKWYLQFEKSE